MLAYQVLDANGNEVHTGDVIKDFRGQPATFKSVTRGTEYNGTAKVLVTQEGEFVFDDVDRETYASVFNLKVTTLCGVQNCKAPSAHSTHDHGKELRPS